FPGNVRQLENLCHWLTVLAPAQVVKVEDLPLDVRHETAASLVAPGLSTSATPAVNGAPVAATPPSTTWSDQDWLTQLTAEVERRLKAGTPDVMDVLAREFEATVIRAALKHTHGRRIDAATRLGVGRNTITRKIQDLGLEE
ncbi:MAG TPA: helix-turn-helix domain-containing protein, partial [Burkholderiaceae bacterium]|nr:helix-turn-helix domain-containing protein [Burkholderiaceae bacterium]